VQIDRDLYPWFSVAAIVWGLLDCFFGYRVFKLTIALLGAVAGALLAQAGAQAAGLGNGGELAALVVGALLGAGLAFLAYIAAVFVAGFGFGATLAMLLLSHFHPMVAVLGAVVVGVIGGLAAVKLQRVIIILATALMGSFRAIFALMFFTNQLDWLYHFRQPQQIPGVIDTHAWVLPSVLVLAAVGAIAQFGVDGGKGGGGAKKKDKKEKPAKKD
jgi:hypothetical protein